MKTSIDYLVAVLIIKNAVIANVLNRYKMRGCDFPLILYTINKVITIHS